VRRLLEIFDTISEWTGRIWAWVVVVVTAVIVYEVISRRLFHEPHVWTFEVTTFLFSIHFMMVAAYTLLYRDHVSVDLISSHLSRRWQAALDVVNYLIFFFPFMIILIIAGTEYASDSWATGERTLTARLPIVMPGMKTLIPLASFLLLLQGLSQFFRSLVYLLRGREL